MARIIKLDLHGYHLFDAVQRFIEVYNKEVKKSRRRSILVVHGYGSSGAGGVIRAQLRDLLTANLDKLYFTEGEYIDGNPGYTVVEPMRELRIDSKELMAKLRHYRMPTIQVAFKELINQGRLKVMREAKLTRFELVQ